MGGATSPRTVGEEEEAGQHDDANGEGSGQGAGITAGP